MCEYMRRAKNTEKKSFKGGKLNFFYWRNFSNETYE